MTACNDPLANSSAELLAGLVMADLAVDTNLESRKTGALGFLRLIGNYSMEAAKHRRCLIIYNTRNARKFLKMAAMQASARAWFRFMSRRFRATSFLKGIAVSTHLETRASRQRAELLHIVSRARITNQCRARDRKTQEAMGNLIGLNFLRANTSAAYRKKKEVKRVEAAPIVAFKQRVIVLDAASESRAWTTPAVMPPAPEDLMAYHDASTTVLLQIKDPKINPEISRIKVESTIRKYDFLPGDFKAVRKNDKLVCRVGRLKNGVVHRFRVQTINALGHSCWSQISNPVMIHNPHEELFTLNIAIGDQENFQWMGSITVSSLATCADARSKIDKLPRHMPARYLFTDTAGNPIEQVAENEIRVIDFQPKSAEMRSPNDDGEVVRNSCIFLKLLPNTVVQIVDQTVPLRKSRRG